MKLLMQPLASIHVRTETLLLTKVEVWWYLVVQLGPNLSSNFDQVRYAPLFLSNIEWLIFLFHLVFTSKTRLVCLIRKYTLLATLFEGAAVTMEMRDFLFFCFVFYDELVLNSKGLKWVHIVPP